MKSKLALRKFSDQAWQLTIHTTMTLFEVYLLFVVVDEDNNTSSKWWTNPETCFQPCAIEFAEGRKRRPMVLNQFYLFLFYHLTSIFRIGRVLVENLGCDVPQSPHR